MHTFPIMTAVARRSVPVLMGAALTIATACAQDVPASPAPKTATAIGYPTVADALAAVPRQPGAEVSVTPNGWTIVSFAAPDTVVWSFAPEGHYAAPAVVRRTVVKENGMVGIRTAALCEAATESCDRLMAEFAQMQENMRRAYREQRRQ